MEKLFGTVPIAVIFIVENSHTNEEKSPVNIHIGD